MSTVRVAPGSTEALTIYPSGMVLSSRGEHGEGVWLDPLPITDPQLYTKLRAELRQSRTPVRVRVTHGYPPEVTDHAGRLLSRDGHTAVLHYLARVVLDQRKAPAPEVDA